MNHLNASGVLAASAPPARIRLARIPRWIMLGLLIRFVLLPFHHPWDLQTWYNMFVDLAEDRSPYATFHDLTATLRSQQGLLSPSRLVNPHRDLFYEYYSYPPLLMLMYRPLAKFASHVVPLERQFVIHGPPDLIVVPPLFHLFFKTPLFAAEIVIALLLWRMAGEQAARRFFLNPLVILVSAAWTVEALMALFLLLSMYLLRRQQYVGSALALAAGALIKFIPGVLLPVILLYLWHRGVARRTIVAYAATFVGACALIVAPYWEGFREVLLFHAARPGQNMSIHFLLFPLRHLTRVDLAYLTYVVSPVIGVITQTTALVLVYGYLAGRRFGLNQGIIITLLAFFLGSKVVNEPYLYVMVLLLGLELAERPSPAKQTLYRLMYALPLTFATPNVAIVYMAAPLLRQFYRSGPLVNEQWGAAAPLSASSVVLSVLVFVFIAALVYGLRVMAREEGGYAGSRVDQVSAAAY